MLAIKIREQSHNSSPSSPTTTINQGMRTAMYPMLYEKEDVFCDQHVGMSVSVLS